MTMESPAESGVQGSTSSSGSPVTENPPMMHTLQPMAVSSVQSTDPVQSANQMTMPQFSVAQVPPGSMPQTFVMAHPSTTGTPTTTNHSNIMMQPPMPLPLMMSQYQMIVPTQGLVDQQGQLIQQQQQQPTAQDTRCSPAGSPAIVEGRAGSRSATPQQQAVYQQQIIQLKDSQHVKSDNEAVASPVRQGSVGSGGSPAPPTPGSLGSPIPQLMSDGMPPPQGLQYPGHLSMSLPAGLGIAQHTAVAGTPPPEVKEEKIDISKLKPPKKPLTPYMRFSKSIWQQVKAANPSMSVCEIGATIGRMWRELADTEKQKYNEDFANDKISYDVELQAYLKLTGLQASDLVKSRSKKKASSESKESKAAKRQHSQPSPSPQPQPAQNTVVQQVQSQQLIGVPPMLHTTSINGPVPVSIHNSPGATAGLQQQVLSSALSGLPHFSQVWTGQQGATILSQAHGGGQEQVIMQQGAPGQQVLINTLGLPAGTVVNGSTAPASGENPNMISAPILIQPTGEQATQLFSAEGHQTAQDGHTIQAGAKAEGEAVSTSQAATAQLAALGWHQVMGANPGDLQHQQNVLNLLNMAAAQSGVQPDQLTQAAQIAGLQPPGIPVGLQQNMVSINTVATDSNNESQTTQPMDQGTAALQQQGQAASANRVVIDQNGTAVAQTVSNGPNSTGTSSHSVFTVPTAHNLYNSYGFNPWSAAFPQQMVQAAPSSDGNTQEGVATDAAHATTIAPGGIQVVYNRESILETELQHLRSALSEKTKEVQRLTQDLEKAYSIIEQLKQQNPTAVIHLPAPQESPQEQVADSNTPQST